MNYDIPAEVQAAKNAAVSRFFPRDMNVRGIGYSKPGGVWHISLLIDMEASLEDYPSEIDGVPVDKCHVGKIVAQ